MLALGLATLIFRPAHAPLRIAPPAALGPAPVPLVGRLEAQAPVATPAAVVPLITAAPTAAAMPAAQTAHLRLIAQPGSYGQVVVAGLAEPLEDALAYVSARTALQLQAPVTVIFTRHADFCGLDGLADTTNRTIYLYACPATPTGRAVNILAHEFVHQLAHDRYGPAHLEADLILAEGFATWGAGRYWLGRQPDLRQFVVAAYGDGLLPLDTDYQTSAAPDAMNRLYYEWAAFVDWLIATRGRAAFDALYRGGHGHRRASAPYQAVLGSDLAGLDQQWQAWLRQ